MAVEPKVSRRSLGFARDDTSDGGRGRVFASLMKANLILYERSNLKSNCLETVDEPSGKIFWPLFDPSFDHLDREKLTEFDFAAWLGSPKVVPINAALDTGDYASAIGLALATDWSVP